MNDKFSVSVNYFFEIIENLLCYVGIFTKPPYFSVKYVKYPFALLYWCMHHDVVILCISG
jgi:hypothetical protein